MPPLKIAVVTPELPNRQYPNRGLSIYQTLLHLCDRAEVRAFCPLPRYPARFLPRFDYRQSDLSYSPAGIDTCFFEYPVFPVVTRPVNGNICAHYLAPRVRAYRPDVILNFLLYPAGFAALRVGWKLGIPVVVGAIGSDLNAIPDRVSRWLTRKTLHGAAAVLAKSEQLRRRASEMGADLARIHVVANGCDGNIFRLRDRDEARRRLNIPCTAELAIFVGRMHARKGVVELLEAAATLSRERSQFRLAYLGDGPLLAALKANARRENLGSRVQFAGVCFSAEVALWLAAADLLVLPSYAEGSPNVILEALCCGRPVVATSVGDIPELVDDSCGTLVPPKNVNALSSAISWVLDTTWDEHFIAQRFHRGWSQVAEEVLAICEGALNARSEQCAPAKSEARLSA